MNLGAAALLLGDQSRIFTEVYKLYGFREDQTLSEYAEFFLHEPVAWFEGLPGSLKSKASFAKPKTAFSKLMKQVEVIAALGDEFCGQVHDVLWDTYKKEAERIVASRGDPQLEIHEPPLQEINDVEEAHTAQEPKARRSRKQKVAVEEATAAVPNTVDFGTLPMSYETKYRIVDRAFRAILSDVSATNEALLVFLDALKEA